MKITTARQISQTFFLLIFIWFCGVTTLGLEWYQLRGWPVNWFLQLDPLTGLTTILTTRTLYAGLLWGLVTVVLTILLGRFFCGWVCPFGAIHHFVGFMGSRKKSLKEKIRRSRYHPWQSVKYWILVFFVTAAFTDLSIQTGLLDPIPLLHRSVNLVLLPIAHDMAPISAIQRYYDDAWPIGLIFFIAVFMNVFIPRFYCRFICPLGALFGLLSRFAIWRVGTVKNAEGEEGCTHCHLCEQHCEGACEPSEQIRISECLLCMNCLHKCRHKLISYRTSASASGEILSPDLSRREFVISSVSGAVAIHTLRLSGEVGGPNWNPGLIRPPGALSEEEFLARCVKCGQCMRVCPTNVIHPSGITGGLEGLWTPALNFRIGTSGCQLNCIACGHLCPTAAIRPLSLDERKGIRKYAVTGPVKIGTAFVDRNRCLPWAMDKPCIVCQENCPVSPKAISTLALFSTVITSADLVVEKADSLHIKFKDNLLAPRFSTGDYYCILKEGSDNRPRLITKNTADSLTISPKVSWNPPPEPGSRVVIQIRLQQPVVNPNRCVGCGVCEHECPVRGKRAIRVTAENESRDRKHALIIGA